MKVDVGTCILNSHTQNGWGKVLASKPVEVIKGDISPAELDDFVSRQKIKQRLIIGYLSYDYGVKLHGIKPRGSEVATMPDVWLAAFDSWQDFTNNPPPSTKLDLSLKPVMNRRGYGRAYKKIQDFILAGDAYQVNLTHRLEGTTSASGFDIFSSLAKSSQNDFQAYLNLGDFEIISQSPERFIRVHGAEIMTMPIKGTRPRGKNPVKDHALKTALLDSVKDQAELNMITDLMRNDLGEICLPGSVKVSQTRQITGYPTIWHTHSTINGRLRSDVSPIQALVSVLPGGSITGCPKRRAMEIIDELEPVNRGVYTGSIFTINPNGDLDSSIAIRTLVKAGRRIYLSVGGGIVYDSDEAEEYQESLDKAASFRDM